ncbi:MAG TPA: formate--tetrahydrofolate ligase, partial [Elusimicrobia bacterium]|nr:formate--tetrahydrofolate ligase [Elusimicrobiota bacterium]
NKLNIDANNISWRRVVDINDRSLRNIKIGLGSKEDGVPRKTGFDISAASEIMAVLSLTSGLKDLRKRLGKIVVAFTSAGLPVTAEDLGVAGSMTVLLKDAVKPNLLQTTEHTPCFVHMGPFGNIAHGNSSILADRIAVKLADYVVTESGFGADCGMEKFMDIKCRYSGLTPDCVVVVCSIRALKMHSGKFNVVAGRPLDEGLPKENIDAIAGGFCNLEKHIENAKMFGVPVVVAVNKFSTDTDKEIEFVRYKSLEAGADDVAVSTVWENGGAGGKELAEAVVNACAKKSKFKFLYPTDMPIKEKIRIIATKIYGAKDVRYTPLAEEKIKLYTKLGWDNIPICMAKTQFSLSHDPSLKGKPEGFVLPVNDVGAAVGAGFLYPLCGRIRTMPGLPSVPAGTKIDIDKNGKVIGLF